MWPLPTRIGSTSSHIPLEAGEQSFLGEPGPPPPGHQDLWGPLVISRNFLYNPSPLSDVLWHLRQCSLRHSSNSSCGKGGQWKDQIVKFLSLLSISHLSYITCKYIKIVIDL